MGSADYRLLRPHGPGATGFAGRCPGDTLHFPSESARVFAFNNRATAIMATRRASAVHQLCFAAVRALHGCRGAQTVVIHRATLTRAGLRMFSFRVSHDATCYVYELVTRGWMFRENRKTLPTKNEVFRGPSIADQCPPRKIPRRWWVCPSLQHRAQSFGLARQA